MGCEGPFSAPGKSSASLQNLAVTLWGQVSRGEQEGARRVPG